MVGCGCSRDSFASQARSRILIQTAATADDEYGGRSESWTDAYTVWAKVEPMAGREIFVSAQLQSRIDSRMTIRYIAALSNTETGAKARVKLGNRIFNVLAVKNLHADMKTEGRVFQQLLCVEGQPS